MSKVTLRELMSSHVVTVPPGTRLTDAARRMTERRISSLVVDDGQQRGLGIITERDVLRAFRERKPGSTPVEEVMSRPLRTATPETSLFEAYRLMVESNLHHLVIVDTDGALLGMVSDSDFRPHLARCHSPEEDQVRFLMNPYIPVLSPTASVADAASLMSGLQATCVVLEQDRKPLGIFTMRDMVRLFEGGDDTAQRPLAEVMSQPVVTIEAQASPRTAWERLHQLGLRHLVVVGKEGLIVGLVTQADLLRHRDYSTLLSETESLARLARSLGESQAKLRSILDTVTDLIALLTPEGVVLEMNRPALDLIALDSNSVNGQDFWRTAWWQQDPEQAEHLRRAVERAGDGAEEQLDAAINDRDSKLRHLEFALRPIRDTDQRVRYLLAVGRDVTQHKRDSLLRDGQGMILEMIARGEESLERILLAIVRLAESVDSGTRAAVMLVRDGQLHLGAAPGLPLDLASHLEGSALGPSGITCARAAWHQERTVSEAIAHDPCWELLRDSAVAHGLAACWSQPVCAADGRVLGTFAVYSTESRSPSASEISLIDNMANLAAVALERNQSQHALESERGRLLALLDAIPDLVSFKDPAGFYLNCNRAFAAYLERPEGEIIGQTDFDLSEPNTAAEVTHDDRTVLAQDEPKTSTRWFVQPGKQRRGLFETIKAPVRTSEGETLGTVSVAREITARHEAEIQLRLAASVFDNSHDGVIITDPQGLVIDANQSFLDMTGYPRNEVVGHRVDMFRNSQANRRLYFAIFAAVRRHRFWQGELTGLRKNGESYVERLTLSAVSDEGGEITHYVGVLTDITALKESQSRLEQLAHYDPLTRLPNRTLLSDRMQQLLPRTERHGALLAVCYLDLDGFKPINDNHGHHVGDRLLVELAQRLQHTVRGGDTVARLGGDEFVLLLADLRSISEMETILDRVLERMSAPTIINDQELRVSASIGVTLFPNDHADADTLLRHADQAMYRAKESGRATYEIFDVRQDQQSRDHREHFALLREAMHQTELLLYYQPKVDLSNGRVVGMEALIRWQHPEKGLLAPGTFLPATEGTPLADEIDRWVIIEALRQMDQWRRQGLVIPVSVNISARSLQRSNLREWLTEHLARFPEVPPQWLELEVLETNALDDVTVVGDTIRACADLGISFALDDFGTGYSSLTYLRRLPARVLKIDRSFVDGMLSDPEDHAIVEGVLGLAHAFDRLAVAEGVETPEQGRSLRDLGCNTVQGYGIARPMPAHEVPAWVAGFSLSQEWISPQLTPISPVRSESPAPPAKPHKSTTG